MPEYTKRTVSPPTLDGELARIQRIARLEDAPMRRYTQQTVGSCGRESQCAGELATLLARQNELLCDILGAVNALTASRLAQGKTKEAAKETAKGTAKEPKKD